MGSLGIEELLHPLDVEAFMADTWGQTCRLIPGDVEKFAGLTTWDELNQWLGSDLLFPPRLRLFKDGSPIETERFVYTRPGGSKSLNPAALTAALADGAALSVDLVDRLLPAVRETVGRLEGFFATSAHVNLYAGWRTNNGFGVHWDPQEVFVMQIEGNKEWLVYEPTRLHPLAGESPPKPQGDPTWQGTLTPGDLLYLPRGWWHMARPLDEPSLHLTLTVVPPVAPDFIKWSASRMPEDASMRSNLPRPGAAFTAPHALTSAESMPAFLTDWAAQTWVRPAFDLPAAAEQRPTEIIPTNRLRLSMSKALSIVRRGDSIRMRTGSVDLAIHEGQIAALTQLSGDEFTTATDLAGKLAADQDMTALLSTLETLRSHGALWVEDNA